MPEQIKPPQVRAYLTDVQQRGVKGTMLHAHAQGIKTFLRFLPDAAPRREVMSRALFPGSSLYKPYRLCSRPQSLDTWEIGVQ